MKRPRDWRLPVRYRVPPRNDLIAFALMALAFGLMVGLAIAPGWGNAGSTGPVITLPAEEEVSTGPTGDTGSTTVANLMPPAGGESSPVSDSTSTDDSGSIPDLETDSPEDSSDLTNIDPDPESEENYTDPPPDPKDPDPDPDPEPALIATVVGADEAGYAVADVSGNLLFVHFRTAGATQPKVGTEIGTGIDPLDNGTFVQFGGLQNRKSQKSSKLTGIVSWADPATGVITVSARGASIAVDAAKAIAVAGEVPAVGARVVGVVAFDRATKAQEVPPVVDEPGEVVEEEPEEPLTMPSITAKSLEVVGEPGTQIELSGPVSWDPALKLLMITADGFGALNREIEIAVPKSLKLKGIQQGTAYAATADIAADGSLTLAGLSANSSKEAAADQAQAFGTHAR